MAVSGSRCRFQESHTLFHKSLRPFQDSVADSRRHFSISGIAGRCFGAHIETSFAIIGIPALSVQSIRLARIPPGSSAIHTPASLSILGFFAPSSRIALLMENCDDVKCFIAHFEVNGVRKSMKQCSANVFLDLWKLKWDLQYSLHYGIKLGVRRQVRHIAQATRLANLDCRPLGSNSSKSVGVKCNLPDKTSRASDKEWSLPSAAVRNIGT